MIIAGGVITAIHVVTADTITGKHTVRNVESALYARWNLNIDHRKISVVRLRTIPPPSTMRLKLVSVASTTTVPESRYVCQVTLAHETDEATGNFTGPNFPPLRMRGVAQATLDAVTHFLPTTLAFSVMDVRTTVVAGRPAVVVAVVPHDSHGAERVLSGAVYFGNEQEPVALARAALDAINRRIGRERVPFDFHTVR